jgi:hypothetical protein
MKQPSQRLAHRQTEHLQTGSFTFWYRRPNAARQVGAWMLDQDADEAAFLTATRDAPRVGERLELTELCQSNLAVPRPLPERLSQLPRFGRVVRLDEPEGVTRRVAIRFEQQTHPRSGSRLVEAGT